MSKEKRIAVLISSTFGYQRQILRGIYQYSNDNPDWVLRRLDPDHMELRTVKDWHTDGIISFIGNAQQLEQFASLRIPLVNTSAYISEQKVPQVVIDNEEIGRQAAEYLVGLGFRHCAYYGKPWVPFSQIRGEVFKATLIRLGAHCAEDLILQDGPPGSNLPKIWTENEAETYRWLLGLPKPVGIFALHDIAARYLAEFCLHRKIRIPAEVAILGVDNEDVECLMTVPPLSSIELCGENVGYEAARMLAQLMAGEEPPSLDVRLPPRGVIVRGSTDTLAVDDPDISRALRFIHAHASQHISVDDILLEVPLSRRTLFTRFRRVMGRTLLEEMNRVHVALAKQLLADEDIPIRAVATQAGFRSISNLYTVFNATIGMTPAEFRKSYRRG
ncbi:MAG: DNA-binding transcriptional regulator [bacterium]